MKKGYTTEDRFTGTASVETDSNKYIQPLFLPPPTGTITQSHDQESPRSSRREKGDWNYCVASRNSINLVSVFRRRWICSILMSPLRSWPVPVCHCVGESSLRVPPTRRILLALRLAFKVGNRTVTLIVEQNLRNSRMLRFWVVKRRTIYVFTSSSFRYFHQTTVNFHEEA